MVGLIFQELMRCVNSPSDEKNLWHCEVDFFEVVNAKCLIGVKPGFFE